ncbi:MAG: alpha/beta hydrolase [Candidatus Sumerlaeota bacterium]|nr:alpha/beta hydrolase [Candidatus Sumerlaeota bacterium]
MHNTWQRLGQFGIMACCAAFSQVPGGPAASAAPAKAAKAAKAKSSASKPAPVKPVGNEFTYKTVEGRALKLYVVDPDDHEPTDTCPCIVFFHGGGWVGGSPSQFNEHALYLASRGMVAVLVEYRLLDRASKEPPLVCVEDAKSAMRWVRSRADELGIDPDRIASSGGSAGGHLAAFVGMAEGLDDPQDDLSVSPKSNAMILFNPVFDNGPGGWGTARVGDRYKEFSPFHNVSSDDPPAIVFLGSQDKLIPVKTLESFKEQMEKAGARCETRIYEGQPHGFFNTKNAGGKYYYETLKAADEFLTSLGWLTGPPTLKEPAANSE